MAPTLYVLHPSPPVRAVLMLAKAIDLKLDEKEVNLLEGEHLKEEFLKINPQHTIPTLIDEDGFILWDSHSILTYLVSKYAKDDALYPKDIKKRAVVDQRLHFEGGIVFALLRKISEPIIFWGRTEILQEDKEKAETTWDFLESFFGNNKWIAGDSITVADYSLISSVSSLNQILPIDEKKFPKVFAWIKRAETSLPGYEENVPGLEGYTQLILPKLE